MSTCTFFGHRECPVSVEETLLSTLEELILTHGVNQFYVGHQGQFDAYVHKVLKKLGEKYPHIHYAVVLAYMPGQFMEYEDFSDTMVPEGIESIHPRFAIFWRNNWMLQKADYGVTYVTHTWGDAYRFASQARRKGKYVINIASFSGAKTNTRQLPTRTVSRVNPEGIFLTSAGQMQ